MINDHIKLKNLSLKKKIAGVFQSCQKKKYKLMKAKMNYTAFQKFQKDLDHLIIIELYKILIFYKTKVNLFCYLHNYLKKF